MNPYTELPRYLLPWYELNKRDLPWRQDREPYHVWLSEVMLQQTRVEAVRGYYVRFLQALPDIRALAEAPEEQLHKLWEGLGYYSRVRNLQKAARQIMECHGGRFPADYASVRDLAGIGDYTAGAVCSICFDQPTPAVDGNVLRVCSRLTASAAPIDDSKTKQALTAALKEVYPLGRCGDFTQALMELGATVCLPNGMPKCGECPLREQCAACRDGSQLRFPVKAKKKPRRKEELTIFLLRCGDLWAMEQRPGTGLLAGLWQFPNLSDRLTDLQALEQAEAWGVHPQELERSVERVHIFTHVEWHMRGFYLRCREPSPRFHWADPHDLALPTAFRQFLEP